MADGDGRSVRKKFEDITLTIAHCLSAVFNIFRDWLAELTFLKARLAVLTFLKALGIVFTLVVLVLILIETFRPVIRIDAFAMPHDYEARGFTAQAFSNQLMDAIETIKAETDTFAKKETFSLADSNNLPDFELPETKLSLRAIAQSLQAFLHLQPPHVSGEIIVLPPPESQPKGDRLIASAKTLLVTIRLTDNGERASSQFHLAAPDSQAVVSAAAEEVVRMIDPYIAAVRMYDKGRPKEAFRLLDQCRGDSVKWSWILRGNIFQDEGNYSRAESAYKTALFSIQPDCGKFWLKRYYRPICGLAYLNWGTVFDAKGDYDGAIAKYQEAVELDPEHAYAYNNWGNALYHKGDYDGAIAKYQKVVELDPKYAEAYNNWGNALYDKGDYVGAIAKYRKAVEVDPKYASAYHNWGIALYREGDYEGAIAKVKEALALDSENSRFKQTLEAFQTTEREKHQK
jgi:tetratricopeptide (TPR) repeat protein